MVWYLTLKGQGTKEKIDKVTIIKIKHFYSMKKKKQ